MAGFLDKVGDLFRGETRIGAIVDKAVETTGEERRNLITQQQRGQTFMSAYSRFRDYSYASDFSGRASRSGRLDPSYGPRQLGTDIAYLRDEALRVAMVNPHANKAIEVLTSWTIMSGVNIIVKARTKLLQKRVTESTTKYFIESNDSDSTRHGNYWDFENLVASYYFRAGEVLVRARPRDFSDGLEVPVTFEAIDPVMLYDGAQPQGVRAGNSYAAGIEFSPLNHPEAYWLYRGNPRDNLKDRTPIRVPVKDATGQVQIVHLFDKIFPGQIRGIPRAVLVLATIYEQQDLRYSLLRRKRMEAKIGLILKEGAEATENPDLPGFNQQAEAEGAPSVVNPSDVLAFNEEAMLRDNAVFMLPPGWGVDQLVLQNTADYKEFMADLLRTIATGYGILHSQLTADLSDVPFSGSKMGLLDFKNRRLKDQNYIIGQLHRFVWSNFNTAANRAGMWSDPDVGVQFRYDAFPSAEPEKDSRVIESRLRSGTISRQRACAEFGEDFFEIADEIAVEDAYLRDKGLDHLTSEQIMKKVTSKAGDASATDENDAPKKPAKSVSKKTSG